MNNRMSPRRRRLVILCACIAASSGLMGTLLRSHPTLRVVWLVVLVIAMVYAGMEFAKLMKEER